MCSPRCSASRCSSITGRPAPSGPEPRVAGPPAGPEGRKLRGGPSRTCWGWDLGRAGLTPDPLRQAGGEGAARLAQAGCQKRLSRDAQEVRGAAGGDAAAASSLAGLLDSCGPCARPGCRAGYLRSAPSVRGLPQEARRPKRAAASKVCKMHPARFARLFFKGFEGLPFEGGQGLGF